MTVRTDANDLIRRLHIPFHDLNAQFAYMGANCALVQRNYGVFHRLAPPVHWIPN